MVLPISSCAYRRDYTVIVSIPSGSWFQTHKLLLRCAVSFVRILTCNVKLIHNDNKKERESHTCGESAASKEHVEYFLWSEVWLESMRVIPVSVSVWVRMWGLCTTSEVILSSLLSITEHRECITDCWYEKEKTSIYSRLKGPHI